MTTPSEFRPIETQKVRPAWPFAVGGAAVAALAMWAIGHRTAPAAAEKVVASANVASAPATLKQPELAPLTTAAPAKAPAAESPNVLGSVAQSATRVAMVAKAELDRELGRTRAAQKEAAAYRHQIDDLNRQLADARNAIAAIQRSKQPAPPSDREQILQMLAPVLKASNDGRP